MARVWSIALVACLCVVGQALTPSSYFTLGDKERLRNTFDSVRPYSGDLEALHYSILGFTLLEEALQTPQKSCDVIKSNIKVDDVDSLYFGSSAAQTLKTQGKTECKFPLGNGEKVLNDAISAEGATTLNIYYATAALKNLGLKLDSAKVTTALNTALKVDDGPLSYGYAFHAASLLGGDLKKFHDLIEDIVQQADEVDDKFAQFEGGLYTTAVVIEGAYKLAAAANKAPTLTEEKVIQFANYFLSRKHVQLLKNAAAILSVATTLSNNKFHIPITVTRASQVSVSDKYPIVQVRVSNLLGKNLGKLTVTADQARKLDDQAVVLNKEKFTVSSSDLSLYELDFKKVKPASGLYKISISVSPQQPDKRLLGITGAEVEVKVTTQVTVDNVEIGVGDEDQSSTPKTTKLQHPNKAANVLEADHHQKLVMKFTLTDQSRNKPMTAHQAFLRFTNQKTKQEIAFVAEPDSSNVYKFDLDVGGNAKEFGYLSGKYTMDLVVGDAVIQNPLSWTVADVALSFPEGGSPHKEDPYRYSKKPEIKHVFREPEVRPPSMMSTLFTILCFVPLLLMFVMWGMMGANVSNFTFSISALGFHICLGAMFGLYYLYWLQLDMFATLRYLGILAIPTFFFGNRLLSGIAAKRKTA